MISLNLNFFEFINAVKDRDKHIILSLAESEAKEAEKISELTGTGDDYINAILELIYFLRYSQKPGGIKEKYLNLYRVVCENLVAKKQLSPDVLKMLEPQEKYSRVIGKI
ncbi:MAG: hypothetical protein JXA96_12690 [Sedimentisphaerales bacterium]|nr:hypothetical protein [Sedimentisphaerales bacterium]